MPRQCSVRKQVYAALGDTARAGHDGKLTRHEGSCKCGWRQGRYCRRELAPVSRRSRIWNSATPRRNFTHEPPHQGPAGPESVDAFQERRDPCVVAVEDRGTVYTVCRGHPHPPLNPSSHPGHHRTMCPSQEVFWFVEVLHALIIVPVSVEEIRIAIVLAPGSGYVTSP